MKSCGGAAHRVLVYHWGDFLAILPREFYRNDTVGTARRLLGKYLVRRYQGELLAGRITETEAYVGRCDKACHAYGYRKTARTAILFGEPGYAYLYLIYGMYCCLNFVTEDAGEPAAVLIRSLSPAAGLETISRLRFGVRPEELTPYRKKNFLNGPGKLCKGFSLTARDNGLDLTGDQLFVCDSPADAGLPVPPLPPAERICEGRRIGIDYAEEARDFPWRFWLEEA
jgi:DNA-3-methyladenine glycosylase